MNRLAIPLMIVRRTSERESRVSESVFQFVDRMNAIGAQGMMRLT